MAPDTLESLVEKAETLRAFYGAWPSFHDAEVVELHLWRDCIAPTVLLDDSDSGETWATPIEDAYLLRLGWRDRNVYFGEVVRDGRIKSYGRRALTAEVFDEPEGRIGLKFGTSDGSDSPTT